MPRLPHELAIATAARTHLGPLGVAKNGRSPRHWTDDHGWWITNIEFQPSSRERGSYLNVGVQWLWHELPHRAFMVGYRVEAFRSAEEARAFDQHANRLARSAVREVERYRTMFPDVAAAARYYTHPADAGGGAVAPEHWPPAGRIDGGVAIGLLGETTKAGRWFDSYLSVDDDRAWAVTERGRIRGLRLLVEDPVRFRESIEASIVQTRQVLGLPTIEQIDLRPVI